MIELGYRPVELGMGKCLSSFPFAHIVHDSPRASSCLSAALSPLLYNSLEILSLRLTNLSNLWTLVQFLAAAEISSSEACPP